MVKDSWGKKHVCPFCGAMFYDMKKEVVVCPKCQKSLSQEDEIKFLERKKKVETEEDDAMKELGINDEIDVVESDMFFDMENDEDNISNGDDVGYDDEDEDIY